MVFLRAVLAVAVLAVAAGPAFAAVDLVRVHKSERRLELLENGEAIRRYAIALGGDPVGHKMRQGDERTPEGRYVLDWRNPASCCHLSIHISYPDAKDRAAAAARGDDPGGDIMIHGYPNGWAWMGFILDFFDWTNGCIGVTDAAMDEIWAMVPNGTPIEILP